MKMCILSKYTGWTNLHKCGYSYQVGMLIQHIIPQSKSAGRPYNNSLLYYKSHETGVYCFTALSMCRQIFVIRVYHCRRHALRSQVLRLYDGKPMQVASFNKSKILNKPHLSRASTTTDLILQFYV